MFEIPDDDEHFWEDLPLEDITNNTTQGKDGINEVKRLSPETEYQSACKRLRPGSVKSPDNAGVRNDFKISSALPAAPQLGAIIKSKNCTNLNQSQQQQHNRYCHGSEDIELLSPIHSTSRVPAVSQHIIVPKNREPVSHTRQHQSNHNAESPLQTPVRARRKFPGPAGLLPKISPGSIKDNPHLNKQVVSTSPKVDQQQDDSVILSSQSGEDVFNENAWQTLLNDLGEDGQKLMIKFSIATSLQKARKKLLPKGKVPLVMAVIDTVEWQGSDASVCLKDKSGKIHGTVHQSLMKEHQCELQPGTVIVLRQVSVISPTARNHYLNVTPANVVAIYSNMPEGLKTIRNLEKDKSLNSVLQTIESYVSEDISVQRRSGMTPLIKNRDFQHTTTPVASRSMQHSAVMNTYSDRHEQFNRSSNFQTPGRSCNSSQQMPFNSNVQIQQNSNLETPQRPQTSNKYRFVKTPNVMNSDSPVVKTGNSSSFTTHKSVTQSSHNHSVYERSTNENLSFHTEDSKTCTPVYSNVNRQSSSRTSSCVNQRNMIQKEQSLSTKSCSDINRNLCSTDFNSDKIKDHNEPYSKLMFGNAGNEVMYSDNRNFTERFLNSPEIVLSRGSSADNNCTQEHALNSNDISSSSSTAVKNGFRFKPTSKTSNDSKSNILSDNRPTGTDKIQNVSVTSMSNTGSRNFIKRIIEPRPCFEADSLWHDDLSDDILLQLSDELM